MNTNDLLAAKLRFEEQMASVSASRQNLYSLRDSFASYYTPTQINDMPLEHYALGKNLPEIGYHFCYTLERALDGLGRTIGATSSKFGVYYGVTRSDKTVRYRHTMKFGANYQMAFKNVKIFINRLIEAGKNEDIAEIVKNPISPMFKGKILSTYFPDRYLNVFSDDHLKYFLIRLNLNREDLLSSDPVLKREALVAYKNNDEVMRNWPLDLFSYFLYEVYPERPPKETKQSNNPNDQLADDHEPDFPENPEPEWINLDMVEPAQGSEATKRKRSNSNPDYEKEGRKLKKYGDRGEKLVLDKEKERLVKLGRKDLAERVEKAEFDHLGYDIISFEEDEQPRYIEVKATSSKVGPANFFLSSNELQKAQELSNYFIYMVYDILSKTPKIWVIPNPFHPENPNVVKTPTTYRVSINTKNRSETLK